MDPPPPNIALRPSQGFRGIGEKGEFISWEQGNKGQILRGTGEQSNIEEHIFNFCGTGEQANLFQGNKGTGTPTGRASAL